MTAPHFYSVEQVKRFLNHAQNLSFGLESKKERYLWISKTLIWFQYRRLKKNDRTIIKEYIGKITGYSNSQIKRLITKFYRGCLLITKPRKIRKVVRRKYGATDIALLIFTDQVHNRLSAPATKRIILREYQVFGHEQYRNLANISVSHIYNLRETNQYQSNTRFYHKTNPTKVMIGERCRPETNGEPGHLRVDTVHQGDRIGLNSAGYEEKYQKGVYHINTICEVTQWEIIACIEKISEHYLLPVLLAILEQYPFKILGFHADNGSEYINKVVAALLNKLLIKLTKSRPRHSNDNALVETKNGSIIRKHFGYHYIPGRNARLINEYYEKHFNVYLNFHRPSGFATTKIDARGKEKKVYDVYQTPYEALKSHPRALFFLKAGVTFEKLDLVANEKSDNEFAKNMLKAKNQLSTEIKYDDNDFS